VTAVAGKQIDSRLIGVEESVMQSARDLYLDLMKKCLTDLIYADVEEKPNLQLQPFDETKRLEGRDWPT
jgi:hypothetical protein